MPRFAFRPSCSTACGARGSRRARETQPSGRQLFLLARTLSHGVRASVCFVSHSFLVRQYSVFLSWPLVRPSLLEFRARSEREEARIRLLLPETMGGIRERRVGRLSETTQRSSGLICVGVSLFFRALPPLPRRVLVNTANWQECGALLVRSLRAGITRVLARNEHG